MLQLIHTSIKTSPSSGGFEEMIYVPEQDCCLARDTPTVMNVARIYRDCTVVELGILRGSGGLSLDQYPAEGIAVAYDPVLGSRYFLDPITWNFDFLRPFTSAVTPSASNHGVFMRDSSGVLKYYKQTNGSLVRYDSDTGVLESTDVITLDNVASGAGLQFAGGSRVMMIQADGEVNIVDVNTLVVSLNAWVDGPRMAAYDTKRDQILTVRSSDSTFHTYTLRVEPDTLSALSFSPGDFERYKTEEVSVTVLGSNSEPAEGIIVEWELTPVGEGAVGSEAVDGLGVNSGSLSFAKGKISPVTSITNSSGVATTTYCPPGNDWVSGDQEAIGAKVLH